MKTILFSTGNKQHVKKKKKKKNRESKAVYRDRGLSLLTSLILLSLFVPYVFFFPSLGKEMSRYSGPSYSKHC